MRSDMEKNLFIVELCNLVGVSESYADAAWFTLSEADRKCGKKAAYSYRSRFSKILGDAA